MCYVRHRVGIGGCVFHSVNIYISINNLLFLNPAHRSQSRKGRLAADALRQRRDGVKEDYYV
jgi:hypothetical protein